MSERWTYLYRCNPCVLAVDGGWQPVLGFLALIERPREGTDGVRFPYLFLRQQPAKVFVLFGSYRP